MNKLSSLLIFGEVLYDCFPDGSRVLGGAPFNVAWHCQAFGLNPLLISRVGKDEPGKNILTAMSDWGMNTQAIQYDPVHATGAVKVTFDNNQPNYDIVEDSAWDFIETHDFPEYENDAVLYHGSLVMRNSVSKNSLEILKQEQTKSIFVDVNLRAPWWNSALINNIMINSKWLKINSEELDLILPNDQDTQSKARYLLLHLQLDLIVVTLGSAGAIAMNNFESCKVQPENNVEVIDSVGAGDAFTSVLLLGLKLKWPLQTIINRAQEFASQVVGLRGATIQDINFYKPFIKKWSL